MVPDRDSSALSQSRWWQVPKISQPPTARHVLLSILDTTNTDTSREMASVSKFGLNYPVKGSIASLFILDVFACRHLDNPTLLSLPWAR